MKIEEIKMDLFKTDKKYALAHCISEDCMMGAGIAKIFVEKFPKMKACLINCIQRENLSFPTTIAHKENDRLIFNLITKERFWYKPTYRTIRKSIEIMAKMCKKHNIKYLAMPSIGCGLDRLEWNKVKTIIQENFQDTDIEILICKLI